MLIRLHENLATSDEQKHIKGDQPEREHRDDDNRPFFCPNANKQ